ncbi:DUF5675 family protein [Cruoricaptor ignavus]|nr:DUF5675 family protein [Cruoricaptor ignavus]
MELILERRYYKGGTNGTLYLSAEEICKTIELPWRDNMRGKSCIPEGSYRLKKRYTEKRGYHLLVSDVPGRALILFHPANNALKELHGCIAPVSELVGEGVGLRSRVANEKVKKMVFPLLEAKKDVILTIRKAR